MTDVLILNAILAPSSSSWLKQKRISAAKHFAKILESSFRVGGVRNTLVKTKLKEIQMTAAGESSEEIYADQLYKLSEMKHPKTHSESN